MRSTDICIVGGGLAGSTAAAMLGRAGYHAILIDPHLSYPPDFRCEKLDGAQVGLLRKTGLADVVLPAATHDRAAWIARFGRVVEKRPSDQYGAFYDTFVNTMRTAIPSSTEFIHAKAQTISNSAARQQIALSNGEEIDARLVILANGLNIGLRQSLDMTRKELSPCHSIMLGFDLKPLNRSSFDFPSLTYYSERPSDHTAFLTLFPIGTTMRANLCVYRAMSDPWLRQFREAPEKALFALMPGLRKLTGDIEIPGFVKIRPADLYVMTDCVKPGVVLIGDAYGTSCPAAGTGTNKVFTDVERLCNVHIPRWFSSEGMGENKIATFYEDPIKKAADAFSLHKAFFLRSLSTSSGMAWSAQRWLRFVGRLGIGSARQLWGGKFPKLRYGAGEPRLLRY